MSKSGDLYNEYLDALEELRHLPEQEAQARRSAAQTGAEMLRDLEHRKSSISENWMRIERLQRELDGKIHRTSAQMGVDADHKPFPVSCTSSEELLRFLGQMSQEMAGIETSLRNLADLKKQRDMTLHSPVPLPQPTSSEVTSEFQQIEAEKGKSSSVVIASIGTSALLLAALIIVWLTQG